MDNCMLPVCTALVAVLLSFFVYQSFHANSIDDDFARHCTQDLGGYPVIKIDKNVCLSKEAVLDHE